MEIKKLANNALNFSINRVIEFIAIGILVIGFFLLISLVSFSPDDPNFIFPDNTEIKNFFGFRGSFTADFFFQSFGLISLLAPFSLILTGINIFLNKKIFLIIESFFYSILYLIFGSLFFSFFYSNIFELYINGNGGFVGEYFKTTFLSSMITVNSYFFYYFLIFLVLILFLISIQFKIIFLYKFIKKIFKYLFSKKERNFMKVI